MAARGCAYSLTEHLSLAIDTDQMVQNRQEVDEMVWNCGAVLSEAIIHG
jgi:hypothetical protein